MAKCCICNGNIEREDAPALALGAMGQPRLLCDECDKLIETVTSGSDLKEIESAMDRVGKLMADNDPDRVTFDTVNDIMREASERAKAIKDGTYDFSHDTEEYETEEELDEIPEELLESEEDKEKDRIDEEKAKKFDKVYSVLLIILCCIAGLFLAYKALEFFGIDLSKFLDFGAK